MKSFHFYKDVPEGEEKEYYKSSLKQVAGLFILAPLLIVLIGLVAFVANAIF